MKRMLLSLPMLGIALFLVANGLYDALSDYYPEPTRPFGFLLAAWGVLLAALLAFSWARPGRAPLRVIASAAFLPIALIMLGNVWFSFRLGWQVGASSIAVTSAIAVALEIAYFCVLQMVRRPAAG